MDERRNSLNQIYLAGDRGQTVVVLELCKKHLQKFPQDGFARLHYGMVLVQLAQYIKAQKAIQQAIALCPPKALPSVFAQMGHLVQAKGNFKEAVIWYRKAVKHKPEDATFHIFLGSNAFKRGLHKQSEKIYRRALECSKGAIEEAYFNLGGILLGKRKYAEAIKCYEKALKIDPKYKIAKERLDDAKLALLIADS
ncbi:MAG TPA: tetratricopeptide repeat protein [Verrucomicrobiae bacterium]|nr:tetratricopeptide repeat protein [Verrucomicrobiae bacterium]